jgi:hypothetical protein
LETKALPNLDSGLKSGLSGWSAADVDEGESLEEMAIVKLLGSSRGLKNSHAGFQSTGHAIKGRHATLLLALGENRNQNRVNKGEKHRLLFDGALTGSIRIGVRSWRDLNNMSIREQTIFDFRLPVADFSRDGGVCCRGRRSGTAK